MKDSELLPCPFCGSNKLRIPKNLYIKDGKLMSTPTVVECKECFASGPPCAYDKNVEKSWNQRK